MSRESRHPDRLSWQQSAALLLLWNWHRIRRAAFFLALFVAIMAAVYLGCKWYWYWNEISGLASDDQQWLVRAFKGAVVRDVIVIFLPAMLALLAAFVLGFFRARRGRMIAKRNTQSATDRTC